jgi:dTDP-4-dehydrorhamnose reductase
MNVLITGGSGLLGKSLKETRPPNVNTKATWYTNCIGAEYQMDVSNKSQVNYIFNLVKPQIVIHCAANGSVDYAERSYTEVHQVNVEGVKNVAKASRECNAKFVFISTNAVFSGNTPPYNEDSDRQPVNRYGSIKREAEDRVRELNNWLIIRPFLLYGWHYANARSNWFTTILAALTDGRELKLVNDVYWQPTNARDCAKAIWQLMDHKNETYHVASDDRVTLYEFGQMIARQWGYSGDLIKPIASTELKGIAPRPVDTTYDLSKLHEAGIQLPGLEQGLKALQ